jgi:hypothetical protein
VKRSSHYSITVGKRRAHFEASHSMHHTRLLRHHQKQGSVERTRAVASLACGTIFDSQPCCFMLSDLVGFIVIIFI